MKETSPDDSYTDRLRSWAKSNVHGGDRSSTRRPGDPQPGVLPISNNNNNNNNNINNNDRQAGSAKGTTTSSNNGGIFSPPGQDALGVDGERKGNAEGLGSGNDLHQNAGPHNGPEGDSQPVPSPQTSRKGSQLGTDATSEKTNEKPNDEDTGETDPDKPKANVVKRFFLTFKKVLLHTWLNVLLVFVPAGIAVQFVPGMSPGVIFGLNAIAIIPLAGLLSHATETVAHRMGDAIGALMNITFGNAVELIIFMYVCLAEPIKTRKEERSPKGIIKSIASQIIALTLTFEGGLLHLIALVKDEISIVQASLLGSILANLLLILGMCFLLGGLRFREQIYNSTVTQMSACLLSLSVISLVLPTAFHASFSDAALADRQSLTVSRGTSIVLLLVYGIYLLFQLKSHAYMYESTPQDVIDAEATPGPAVAWFDSSSDSESSSSTSDSDSSGRSRETMSKRVKRMVRHGRSGRLRKGSVTSMDTAETGPPRSRPSPGGADVRSPAGETGPFGEQASHVRPTLSRMNSLNSFSTHPAEDDSTDEEERQRRRRRRKHKHSYKRYRKSLKKIYSHGGHSHDGNPTQETIAEVPEGAEKPVPNSWEPRRVDFADNSVRNAMKSPGEGFAAKRPFDALLALKPVAKNLTPTVFTQPPNTIGENSMPTGPVPRVRYGIRRTNSLPGRLDDQVRAPGAMLPSQISASQMAMATGTVKTEDYSEDLSRVSAIIVLLISTGLVAVCAEFMVGSIQGLVKTSSISEVFIGLIILPIVGNAAEHVTAITVAMKNKMDLAIGVAVGSSIQIALFMTPLVVLIGWALNKEMTLYFTLFQTVCLFVSAFIANFLVLDGRSNYLEGALLCATYVIISLVAFFYPSGDDVSVWG